MATLGQRYLTLSDLQGRIDPSGSLGDIIEAASNTRHFIQDALLLEGNESSGHTGTIRTGLPAGTWRRLYGGVLPEASSTKQVTDSVGILESFSEVDSHLLEMSPDPARFRANEDSAFLEGLMQNVETTFFYGSTDTEPEKFMGMAPRYGVDTGSETSENVILNGGVGGDNTSIWMITWDPMTTHLFYGKGTTAGFQAQDMGEERVGDSTVGSATGTYLAHVTHFKWQVGLHLADWRYSGRIANIDASVRDSGSGTGWDDIRINLLRMLNKRPDGRGRTVLYMNSETLTGLEILASDPDNSNQGLQLTDYFGQMMPSIRGVPIRTVDALTDAETLVPAS